MRIEISPAARSDLRSIVAYSERIWNQEQSERYYRSLMNQLESIASYPEIGPLDFALGPGVRRRRYESHNIIYLQSELGDIRILRVMHVRRRITREVLPELE
jgi:plasmid stabilization system protein ParE